AAARRIEYAGSDDRLRRTRLEAEHAGAALVERRRVHLQRQAADDLREKDPGSDVGMDDARVLADPPDAGVLGVDAFLHRSGIDIHARLERLGRALAHPGEQRLHPRADDVVIVGAPRLARHARARRVSTCARASRGSAERARTRASSAPTRAPMTS